MSKLKSWTSVNIARKKIRMNFLIYINVSYQKFDCDRNCKIQINEPNKQIIDVINLQAQTDKLKLKLQLNAKLKSDKDLLLIQQKFKYRQTSKIQMSEGNPQPNQQLQNQSQNGQSSQYMQQNENQFSDQNQEQQNIIDNDEDDENEVASSDSQLQVQDPTQSIKLGQNKSDIQAQQQDPMAGYYQRQDSVLEWLAEHPGEKWTDGQFSCGYSQFYQDQASRPQWAPQLKSLQWKRPEQIIKDPKFMIIEEDKNGKSVDLDIKHGVFAKCWFVAALSVVSSKTQYLQKLVVQKQYFDRGFVSFQFFKNGKWVQVIVDTLLPYQKEQNNRNCVYSSCNNPQQFWISLIEKAYIKLHRNYQNTCKADILESIVDLTGGLSQINQLQAKENMAVAKVDHTNMWNYLFNYFNQKFFLACINSSLNQQNSFRTTEQGQQGILENHYYSIIDMRDFPKDNLRLIRLRNPWGSDGVWTGPFCQQADDWEKYKAVKEDVRNASKTKKSDGSWWMSLSDFMLQFDRVVINKVFPQNWEVYSIEGEWAGKTNGGRCPTNSMHMHMENKTFANMGDKTHIPMHSISNQKNLFLQAKDKANKTSEHIQFQTDDKWFNNPQFRIKVNKDTKLYISLMQQDQKITGQHYMPCSFMICVSKSRTQRIWQRPPQNQIIAEINSQGVISDMRQITHYLVLKKFQKAPGVYMIIPNIVDSHKDGLKKDQSRKFYLRLFSLDALDVTQLTETQQTTLEGQWTEVSAGGSRKIQIKEDGMGKKKGDIKENPNWCKNPQYLISIKQPTMLKIILRKTGVKKYKGWRIGMTVCRYQVQQQKLSQKQAKRGDNKKTGGHNLKRLLQQTSQFLQAPKVQDFQRKLLVQPHQKFKESTYMSEQVSALFFKWNPTEGPFIVVPSSDGEERVFNYKFTVYSNNPIEMTKLDQHRNQAVVGRWQKDISAGGCHLNEKDKQPAHRTWSMNPKYHITFKEDDIMYLQDQPIRLKVTLSIAEKNWKKLNPNTVSGMIGLYFLQKKQGKLTYAQDIVVKQTSFLPVKQISMEVNIGQGRPYNKNGYFVMPSTYDSKIQGTFIVSIKCDRPFEITNSK